MFHRVLLTLVALSAACDGGALYVPNPDGPSRFDEPPIDEPPIDQPPPSDSEDTEVTLPTYEVSGNVTGRFSGLVLRNASGAPVEITGPSWSFTGLADGSAYGVAVVEHATNAVCTVSPNGGVIAGASVTSIAVRCVPFDLDAAPLSHSVTVAWNDVGASQYDLYWSRCSPSPACTPSSALAVTQPFTIRGLRNGAIYLELRAHLADAPEARALADTHMAVLAFDGDINAMTRGDDGIVHVAGSFSGVGAQANGGVVVHGAYGRPTARRTDINAPNDTAIPDGDGGFFVATTTAILHVHADGSADPTFRNVFISDVSTLALRGDELYAGGTFTTVAGATRNYIARFNRTNGALDAWDAHITRRPGGAVTTITVSDTAVFAAGIFDDIAGTPRTNVGSWTRESGALRTWAPTPVAPDGITRLVAHSDGVFVGGTFSSINGVPCSVAQVDFEIGSLKWVAPVSRVFAIADNRLYGLVAESTQPGARTGVGAIDLTTHEFLWQHLTNATDLRTIVAGEGSVYLLGDFTELDAETPRRGLGALDAATGEPTPWDPRPVDDRVTGLAVGNDAVMLTGAIAGLNRQPRGAIAAIAPNGELDAWSTTVPDSVSAMVRVGDVLYSERVAVDAVTGDRVTSWVPPADVLATGMAATSSAIYVYGSRADAPYLGRLDPSTGAESAWSASPNGTVSAVVVRDNTLYVGGDFSSIGGAARTRLAALDATTGLALTWAPAANRHVHTLAATEALVYVGGTFTQVDGITRRGIAAIDRSSGTVTEWEAPGVSSAYAIAADATHVYVCGYQLFDDTYFPAFGSLNAESGYTTSLSMLFGGPVRAIIITGETVFIGGLFTGLTGQPLASFAELTKAPLTPLR